MWNWCRNYVCCCCYRRKQPRSGDRKTLLKTCPRCHLVHSSNTPCKSQDVTPRSQDYETALPVYRSRSEGTLNKDWRGRQGQREKTWLESKYCCNALIPTRLPPELHKKAQSVCDAVNTSTSTSNYSRHHGNKKHKSNKKHARRASKVSSRGDGDYMPITVSAPDMVNSGAADCTKTFDPASVKGNGWRDQVLCPTIQIKEQQHDDKLQVPKPDVLWRAPLTAPSPDWEELSHGIIKFNASYFFKTKRLFVRIICAEGLPPKDCYKYNVMLKLNILPNKYQTKYSKVVGPDLNPHFNEDFNFVINAIDQKVLEITAYDVELQGKYNAIGQTLFYLENINGFMLDHMHTACLYRRVKVDLCPGHILLSLQYDTQRKYMSIKVHEAKHLFVKPDVLSSYLEEEFNTYAQLAFYCGDSKMNSQRTSTVLNSRNPVYNCTFEFDMKTEYPWENFVVTTVWLKSTTKHQADILIGKLILGPFHVASNDKNTSWGLALKGQQTITYWYMMGA